MGSMQRVNKMCSALQMVAVFLCFMVAGGGSVPGLPFGGTDWSLMSIYINIFNIHYGAWGTSTNSWAEGCLLCSQVSAAALL